MTEDPATLAPPPSAADPSWVWLPVTYEPAQEVVVTSSSTPVSVTVTNTIQQLTGSFNVTKAVVGAGKAGGYTPGAEFGFEVTCTPRARRRRSRLPTERASRARSPVGTSCTVTELTRAAADQSGVRVGPCRSSR